MSTSGLRADVVHHRGLQTGEAEVEPLVAHRPREVDRLGVAGRGDPLDGRPAGVAETEEPGDLVERLARSVVDGLTEQSVATRRTHLDEQRVPARHEQHDDRQFDRRVVEQRRVEVRFEVVDPDERHVPREGQRLGRRHTDEEGTDQPRSDRARHCIDAPLVDAGLDDRPGDHRVEQVEVGAAGDLRHHSSERDVQLDLRADDARHDVASAHHQCRRGLVAARLDAQDERLRPDDDLAHGRHNSSSRLA